MANFADQPIQRSIDDELERRRFITEIVKGIRAWRLREAFVLGIYGPWGDGKSSVLNLLKEQLEKDCIVTFFDPWYFNSEERLINAFFSEVFRVAAQGLPFRAKLILRIQKWLFAQRLTSVPVSFSIVGLSISLSDIVGLKLEPESQKQAIARILSGRAKSDNRKIVILIDNLDRLSPDEVLLVLKLIRLCADFENLIYVLAFDDKYVINAIDQFLAGRGDRISGEDYLKKIIQVDVRLPEIDSSILDKFLNDTFNKLQTEYQFEWDEDFQKRFSDFYQKNVRGSVVRNLRDIKKLVNAFAFSLPLVKGEVNLADWLVLEIIRVFCPLAYIIIRDNIEFLAPEPSSFSFQRSPQELTTIKQRFQRLADSVSEKYGEFPVQALNYLFPVFSAWTDRPENPRWPSLDNWISFQTQQRIASPEYRDAYFQFGPSSTRIPDSRISEFINTINNSADLEVQSVTKKAVARLKSEGHLKDFVDKLMLRADKIDRRTHRNFVEALTSLSNSYSRKHDYWNDSEEDRVRAMLFVIVAEYDQALMVQELLDLAIDQAATDIFATGIVVFSQPRHNKILRRFDLVNFEHLKQKLLSRLHNHYIDLEQNIFVTQPDGFLSILMQWSGALLNDQAVVKQYLESQFRKNPQNIGKFLQPFIRTDFRPVTNSQSMFDFMEFRTAFDAIWLQALIKELGQNVYLTDNEKEAVESFMANDLSTQMPK